MRIFRILRRFESALRAILPWISLPAVANPHGLVVVGGTATTATQGGQFQVTASHNAVLHWQSFNIGSGETTRFIQPSAASIVWNQISDQNPSAIFGNLEANGTVVLMNQAGFHFGANSFVSAAGLVISTAPVAPVESSAGLFWQFNGAPPQSSIVNYGRLQVGAGGTAFLIAEHIENHGEIAAPGGTLGLHAGKDVLISERPDGRGLSALVTLPSGSIDNSGRLIADAGSIALNARVVNQNGLLQANSVRDRAGTIELVASESVSLGAQSVLSARGGTEGASPGGEIAIRSSHSFSDAANSRISVAGGSKGGDGGFVEISAPHMSRIHSSMDGRAIAGGTAGRLMIDPQDIILGTSGSDGAGTGTVGSGDSFSDGALHFDVDTAFTGFSQIRLQATRDITLEAGTTWYLNASTGTSEPGSHLTLEAGNNITIGNAASLVAGKNWSVTLDAGHDFETDGVRSGTGNILFAGTGSLQSVNGDLHLRAGNGVSVAAGHVRTTGGGNIAVEAVGGSISTGTKANGFQFLPGSYIVDPDLGGISTAGGGDVSLVAGQDVVSYLPLAGGTQTDAGSGAFGIAPGNVKVAAGRDVSGHFVVRNGEGRITAGRDAGTTARLLALSLVKGGWTVTAERDVLLQEVRNPNGMFNNRGFGSSPTRHFFDYSPDAYSILTGGNSVQLRGSSLPRFADAFSQGMTPLYPGTVGITAGAGGVVLGNDVTLFPSPLGNLRVTTHDGGSLVGAKAGDLAQFILSDSDKKQYREFGDFGIADHGASIQHRDDPEPVRIDLAGNMSGILLGVPKRAEITIAGNMVNSRFEGQNLHDGDVTRIDVKGDIINRNEFTSVPMNAPPDLSVFDPVLNLIHPPLNGDVTGLANRLFYNADLRTLSFQGRMTGAELQTLLHLSVRVFDANGIPRFLPNGEPVTRFIEVLPETVARQLFTASQDVPLNPDTGYRLGGGGTLDVRARNLDLGATVGIVSQGPRDNPALASLFTHGADVQVTLVGNLDMYSTRIASLNGGDITVLAEGDVNVGSSDFISSDASARGIFTVDPSDVTVIARGDIRANGSRIAAYDGGNVTVRSLEGNVDAGSGGGGSATVEKIHVDPVTRRILSYTPTIPGSGILATTFPPSLDPAFPASVKGVGNILVETPRGNIVSSSGGVVQIPLNGVSQGAGTVTLVAGSKDAEGNTLYEGSIDASGSGVIGTTVKLEATGDIKGLVFARESIDLQAQQNVNVTALAQGNVSVGAGGNVSGTIIGVGSVSASGATVDAALLSQNISASGNVTSSQVGFGQANAAGGTSQSLANDDETRTTTTPVAADESEDTRKKKDLPRLSRTVGRVTVILPKIQTQPPR